MTAYEPGFCNIGPKEIKTRRRVAIAGTIITVILAAYFIAFDIAYFLRITIFIPAYAAALGWLQSRRQFCVWYGINKVQNTHDGIPKHAGHPADTGQAFSIMLQSFFIAAMVMLLVLVIR